MSDMDRVRDLISQIDFKEKLVEVTKVEVETLKAQLVDVIKAKQ